MFNKSVLVVSALALSSFASAALNAFTSPLGGETLKGATTIDIQWKPDGGKNVKLILKKGDSKNLDDAEVIAANIPNSGTYKWEVPNDVASGKDYAFAIEDLESEEVNYTGQFSLATDVAAKPEKEEDDDKKTTSSSTTTKSSTTMVTKTSTSAAETTTADKEDEEEEEEKETKESKTTSAKPTTTADKTDEEKETVETDKPESSASALSKSPLALVFCLAGAFFYLN